MDYYIERCAGHFSSLTLDPFLSACLPGKSYSRVLAVLVAANYIGVRRNSDLFHRCLLLLDSYDFLSGVKFKTIKY